MKQDRFLIVILAFVGLLVVAALGLFFIRQDIQDYGTDTTPDGVVRNYVIAIYNDEFQKAYNYLGDSPSKPDYQEFIKSFLEDRLNTSNISVKIIDTKITEDEAIVKLILTHGSANPFEGSWSENRNALLTLQDSKWKLIEMPYPYWGWDWY